MTYDKDIRVCMISMTVIGVLMVVGLVINLIMRNWIIAASYTLWIWAGGVMVKNAESHQRTRDETRKAMADMMRTWAATSTAAESRQSPVPPHDPYLHPILGGSIQPHPIILPPPTDAEVDAMYKSHGYKSFRCPKCNRLSHLPAEVEPYCIECLAESAHL